MDTTYLLNGAATSRKHKWTVAAEDPRQGAIRYSISPLLTIRRRPERHVRKAWCIRIGHTITSETFPELGSAIRVREDRDSFLLEATGDVAFVPRASRWDTPVFSVGFRKHCDQCLAASCCGANPRNSRYSLCFGRAGAYRDVGETW